MVFKTASSKQLPRKAWREYRSHLFYRTSCCTSGRSSVNAPSLLNHIKFHPFQKGKYESFALCLEPIDLTKESKLISNREAHPQHLLGSGGSCLEEHSVKSPSSTGGRHRSTTVSVHSPLSPLISNVHIHSRHPAHTPSAGKGSSVVLLPRFPFMINWNTPDKSGTFQKLHYCHCQLWLSPRTLSSKKRKCPAAVKGEQTALARTS